MDLAWVIFWALGISISTGLGAYVVRYHRDLGLPILMTFFAIYIVGGNILVPRLVSLDMAVTTQVLTSGSIIWPFTAQLSDMINEIYGRNKAYISIGMAYLANLMFVVFVYTAMQATPLWDGPREAIWQDYFGVAPRILLASGISFMITNGLDATLFAILKRKFLQWERNAPWPAFLGLASARSTVTDVISQAMDPWIFLHLAFIGTMPESTIVAIATGTMWAKIVLSAADVPFFTAFKALTRDVKRDF